MSGKRIFSEALISLRHRLSGLPNRSKARRSIMQETAALYVVYRNPLYTAPCVTITGLNRYDALTVENREYYPQKRWKPIVKLLPP